MDQLTSEQVFNSLYSSTPLAHAVIRGSSSYPDIIGNVMFYQQGQGTIVLAEVFGLPSGSEPCGNQVFGFHIHGGKSCTGTPDNPFADANGHYDSHNCPHPEHQGDMPPLFGNNGFAFMTFYTERFSAYEIIGKTIIVHAAPDDFTTQPSGNSGKMIACGEIRYFRFWN